MSDLQLGLILLGVLLILIVLVFNWWQDRRIRRRMQEHFPENDHDPLMAGSAAPERREPALGVRLAAEPEADDPPVHDPEEVDPATEAVIDIKFAQAVETVELFPAVEGLSGVGSKPLRIFAESDAGLHRSALRPGEAYVSLQLAVLLANRSGAITEIEWSQLWSIAQEIAQRFDGAIEGPEQNDVVAIAQALDARCAALDAQVGLALQPAQPLSARDALKALEDAGFVPVGQQLGWMSEDGVPRFTALLDSVPAGLFSGDSVQRVDLLLDVPNSPADEQAFSRMASVGRDLSRRLNAELLDDQGHPVSAQADQAIDAQLLTLYGNLAQAGFVPGQPRTRKVFS